MSELGLWPISVTIPVAWGDMDALRHVNNLVYLRWFETARIVYFERLLGSAGLSSTVGPILARQEIDYRLPVTYPDTVRAETTISSIGRTSLTLEFRVHSAAHGQIAAEGRGVMVMIDYSDGSKSPIDDAFRAKIYEIERS